MKKLLIAGALGLAAVLGAPAGALAAETKTPLPKPSEPVTAPTFQSPKLGLVLYVDTVVSGKPASKEAPTLAGCSQTSIIHVGETIVFRMWGVNAKESGASLTESNVEQAYVRIPGVLVNGVPSTVRFALAWGQHNQSKTEAGEKNKHAYWTVGVPTKGEVQKEAVVQSESASGEVTALPEKTKIEIPPNGITPLGFTVHVVSKPVTIEKTVKVKVKAKGKKGKKGKPRFKKEVKKIVEPALTGEFSQANFPVSSQLMIEP